MGKKLGSTKYTRNTNLLKKKYVIFLHMAEMWYQQLEVALFSIKGKAGKYDKSYIRNC